MLRAICAAMAVTFAVAGLAMVSVAQPPQLSFSLGKDADKPVTVTVTGKILDAQTKAPLAGAQVRGHIFIMRYRGPDSFDRMPHDATTTDASGGYKLTFQVPTQGLSENNTCVCASAEGYESRPIFVRQPLRADAPITADLLLEHGKLVKGIVVDQQNQPIEGALVSAENNWNGDWQYFHYLGLDHTNKQGEFAFWVSTDKEHVIGEPWLEVSKAGYGVGFFLNILKDEPLGTLQLPLGGTIAGKVIDKDGKPVPNCRVAARDFRREVASAVTDVQGEYELKGILGKDVLKAFQKARDGSSSPVLSKITIYALPTPDTNLWDAVKYIIIPNDAQTVQGPDLVLGSQTAVAGRLVPAKSPLPLAGLMVRLDYDWGTMIPVDGQGNFRFGNVAPGKHILITYLPNNLRYDRGIGRKEVTVEQGKSLENVAIQLEGLVEVRAQYLDSKGEPLEGISAGATWSKSGDGGWTEGTKSDRDGWSVLYLYPGEKQYVRGFDRVNNLVAEGFVEVDPKPGQAAPNLRIVMVKDAAVHGTIQDETKKPLAEKEFVCQLKYADGIEKPSRIKTDASGGFKIDHLVPGVISLSVETKPVALEGARAPMEIKPGSDQDAGAIVMARAKLSMISGQLVASPTFANLGGFKIRLDLDEWEPMVPTDDEGRFQVLAKPGKHRLTAYLPFNLRTDHGVGHVEIEVKDGNVKDVKLPLETLASVQMKIVDASGKPLEGISAAAWWTPDHSGVFTEGTKSEKQGLATLYMYPDDKQYVGAHDWDGKYRLKEHKELTPKMGQVVNNITVVMVPADGQE